jgi:hypothetical protein
MNCFVSERDPWSWSLFTGLWHVEPRPQPACNALRAAFNVLPLPWHWLRRWSDTPNIPCWVLSHHPSTGSIHGCQKKRTVFVPGAWDSILTDLGRRRRPWLGRRLKQLASFIQSRSIRWRRPHTSASTFHFNLTRPRTQSAPRVSVRRLASLMYPSSFSKN